MRAAGAASVTVAAPTAFKLELAASLGADRTVLMDRADLAGSVRALTELTGGAGYDLTVDATGAAAVAEVLLPLTRNGGTAVFYGVTDEADRVSISPYDVFRRELTIKGSFAEISSFPAAIAALRAGRARTDGLITHRFALDDYGLALEALRSDRTAHKVVVVRAGAGSGLQARPGGDRGAAPDHRVCARRPRCGRRGRGWRGSAPRRGPRRPPARSRRAGR